MRAARVCLSAAVLTCVQSFAVPARAGGSFADREAARSLSSKAYELFEARQYRRAIELFQQAEAHFHAPPHLVYTARAQVKLSLYIQARATYERVIAERLSADAPAPFREAQTQAHNELAEIEALTPSLVVTLADPAPPGARVLLDGEPLTAADLGRPRPVNPGAHAVIAEAPGMVRVERTVVLASGRGDERVALVLVPATLPSPTMVPVVISFSVGAVGLVAGTTGAILLRQPSSSPSTALRVLEVAGFTAGGLGVGAGILLLALRPRAPAAALSGPAVRIHVGVGPGSMSFGGTF